jgi:hypothetical protein
LIPVRGVWLDCFEGIWFTPSTVETFLRDGKRVAIQGYRI